MPQTSIKESHAGILRPWIRPHPNIRLRRHDAEKQRIWLQPNAVLPSKAFPTDKL
jgi:hypothetical protein